MFKGYIRLKKNKIEVFNEDLNIVDTMIITKNEFSTIFKSNSLSTPIIRYKNVRIEEIQAEYMEIYAALESNKTFFYIDLYFENNKEVRYIIEFKNNNIPIIQRMSGSRCTIKPESNVKFIDVPIIIK